MIFSLGDDAQIDGIGMIDSPTKLVFSKTDLGGTELPGAQIEILDQSGNVIESWISAAHPHEIIGTLTPGKSYIMRETGAPDGFAYAEEIPFTVSEDGTVEADFHAGQADARGNHKIQCDGRKGTAGGADGTLGGEGRRNLG